MSLGFQKRVTVVNSGLPEGSGRCYMLRTCVTVVNSSPVEASGRHWMLQNCRTVAHSSSLEAFRRFGALLAACGRLCTPLGASGFSRRHLLFCKPLPALDAFLEAIGVSGSLWFSGASRRLWAPLAFLEASGFSSGRPCWERRLFLKPWAFLEASGCSGRLWRLLDACAFSGSVWPLPETAGFPASLSLFWTPVAASGRPWMPVDAYGFSESL